MFEKGEYIVYGTTGVCQVMDITTMKQKEALQAKLYYVLEPVSSPGGKILTPVEENKNPMRRIVTREEADRLIQKIICTGSWRFLSVSPQKTARDISFPGSIRR